MNDDNHFHAPSDDDEPDEQTDDRDDFSPQEEYQPLFEPPRPPVGRNTAAVVAFALMTTFNLLLAGAAAVNAVQSYCNVKQGIRRRWL